MSGVYSSTAFLLLIILFGPPVNGQSTGLTTRQATYVIGAIAAFYIGVCVILIILTCYICNGRKKGRVCPISQNVKKKHHYADVTVKFDSSFKNLPSTSHLKPAHDLSAKLSSDTVDLANYPTSSSNFINPGYTSTTNLGKSTDKLLDSSHPSQGDPNTTTQVQSKFETNSPKKGKKVSIATVISNTDTIDGDDDYSSDNSVTEI